MDKNIRARNWSDEIFERRERIAGYIVRKDCELEGEEVFNQLNFLTEWEENFRNSEYAEGLQKFIFRIQVEKARMQSIIYSRKCKEGLENLGKIKA